MKKENNLKVLKRRQTARRFRIGLAGNDLDDYFVSACHYWKNMNERIINDICEVPHLKLKFSDLIRGDIEHLEEYIGLKIKNKTINKVTSYGKLVENKYPEFDNWENDKKKIFNDVCGPTMKSLGYD